MLKEQNVFCEESESYNQIIKSNKRLKEIHKKQLEKTKYYNFNLGFTLGGFIGFCLGVIVFLLFK
jgi:hypothetical protein